MGDAGIGHTPHNNGVEGNWPHFTQAVCGSAGKSRQLHLDVFAGNMIKYITDLSKETALKHLQAYGSHRFLVTPQLLPRQWKALQNLDVRHLQHAMVIGTKEHASTWAGYMEELVTMEGPLKTPPGGTLVTDQIACMHTEFEQIAINRMDIECIIIPSYHLLRELDRNSAFKDTAAFHGEVTLRSERYYDLVVKP
jgi:hypothetical protein